MVKLPAIISIVLVEMAKYVISTTPLLDLPIINTIKYLNLASA